MMAKSVNDAFAGISDQNNETETDNKRFSYPFLVCENQEQKQKLEEILFFVASCKTGKKLIDDAIKHNTVISLDPAIRAYGSYDEVKNILKINEKSGLHQQIATMAHELRHAQQFQNGILMDAYLDHPKCYIQNQAVIEADASACATAVCFQLAVKGYQEPLEALRQKDPHIVNPFQNQVALNKKIDEKAYAAAFKGWFSDYSTRDAYDSLYIKMVRQRFKNASREDEEKKFERVVSVNDIVKSVCSCDGKTYLSEKQTADFFSTQDACSVSFERFNAIYANCCSKFNFDWTKPQDEVMKEKLGLVPRPHSGYMPAKVVPEPMPIPFIDLKQAEAADKIAAAKVKRQINPLLAASLRQYKQK